MTKLPPKKYFNNLASSIFIYLLVFGFSYPFILYGLDVTDTGFNLTRQLALFSGGAKYEFGMRWLSDFIGGIWLLIFGHLGLYGAKLGWCALNGLFSLLVFHFLRTRCDFSTSFVWTLFISFLLVPGRIEILYYTNIGSFFILANGVYAIYFLKNYMGQESLEWSHFGTFSALSAAAIMARFPNIIFPALFIFILLLIEILQKGWISKRFLNATGKILATLIGIIFITLVILLIAGRFGEYIHSLKIALNLTEGVGIHPTHSVTSLLKIYWRHFTWMLAPAGLTFILISFVIEGFHRIERSHKPNKHWPLLIVGTIPLIYLYTWASKLNDSDFRGYIGSLFLLVIIALLNVRIIAYFKSRKTNTVPEIGYLCIALATCLSSFAGSNVGFLNISQGLWLLIAIVLFIATKQGSYRSWNWMTIYATLFLATLAICSIQIGLNSPYRDTQDRAMLTTPVDHPRLHKIKTTELRAKSFGEFLKACESRFSPGDSLLAYNSIPLVYFITETQPYLGYPWPTINGYAAAQYLLQQAEGTPQPKFVVRAVTNTQSHHWGNGQIVPPHEKHSALGTQVIDNWVNKNGYRIVWRNIDFVIFEHQ